MSNSVKGATPLELKDGRKFTLVMDFEMRVQVEDLTGLPFAEVGQRAARGFHGAVRAIFWGALQRHHSDLTMDDITALIEEHSEEMEAALVKAGEAATPPPEDREPGNRKGRRAGKSSGSNGAKRA